jgi:hypothetical protein
MRALDLVLDRLTADVPEIPLDHFQRRVLEGLHLEFFLESCRVLFTPHLSFLTTGAATTVETNRLRSVVEDQQHVLEHLKRYVLYHLSLCSGLLETSSYLIALNDHLLISRFISSAFGDNVVEVKLYTNSQKDLIAHYKDKIYLGRDFMTLDGQRRAHLGLEYLQPALRDQVDKLRLRLDRHVPKDVRARVEEETLQAVDDNLEELETLARDVTECYPPDLSSRTVTPEGLLVVNRVFREIKHLLIEVDESLRELEEDLLQHHHAHAARYVTRMRKDVENHVNFILIKVNGRISDSINGFRI